MSGKNKDNPSFVTHAECVNISSETRDSINEINNVISFCKKDLSKIKDSLYGVEHAGKVEGGLVNMVSDISKDIKDMKNNGTNNGLGRKEKAAIYIAFIGSIGSVIATYLG